MSLRGWRLARIKASPLRGLHYVAPINNLASILEHGLLPLNEMKRRSLLHNSFAEESVQNRRHIKYVTLSDNTNVTVHDLVPLYLTPKTPTLSARRSQQAQLTFLDISADAICDPGIQFAFSDGNAGASDTSFYHSLHKLDRIPWNVIFADYWSNHLDGKRQRCSEFLLYPHVAPEYINRIVFSCDAARSTAQELLAERSVARPLVVDKSYFF